MKPTMYAEDRSKCFETCADYTLGNNGNLLSIFKSYAGQSLLATSVFTVYPCPPSSVSQNANIYECPQ
jgi:hypothetical protein